MALQKTRGVNAVLAALLAASLAACTAGPDVDQDADVMQSDPAITTSIQSQYFVDDTVKGIAIDVDTNDGVVTLAGRVDSELEKQRAVALAQNTDGVVRVEDRLVVQSDDLPTAEQIGVDTTESVNAGWITTKVESQYFLDPDVKGRNINVTTSTAGVVTLRGEVDTQAAKQQAVTIARNTEGVTDVVDELTLAPAAGATAEADRDVGQTMADAGEEVADGWITTKIQARYFLDTDIKGRDIDVTTANGTVTLNGTVETGAQKREALAIARETDGVTDVNDQLQVVPAEREPAARAGEEDDTAAFDDAWLTTKIQAQYFVDPDVSSMDIDVTTENRVVTLEGDVETATEKTLAEAIARDTKGVERVVNRLVVQNGEGR